MLYGIPSAFVPDMHTPETKRTLKQQTNRSLPQYFCADPPVSRWPISFTPSNLDEIQVRYDEFQTTFERRVFGGRKGG